MGNREAMMEVTRRAYEARDKGDLEGLLAAFHPDAVFTLVGDEKALEVAGSVRGHPELRESLRGFITTFDFAGREILSDLIEGDRAAVHSRLVVRFKPTGESRTTDILDLLRFQDGKIIELIEFADTALVSDLISGTPAP
jgi:ketosteroid isomerase-like protein